MNDLAVCIFEAMTVRHALLKAGVLDGLETSKKVYDEWGNEIGLDGALTEGSRIYAR
ncbi:MAG: hypothetical protein HZB33_09175 [Nitrospirae bacterium]|nr:hypothetical protein [Nitrospirota bacterium]